MTLLILMSFPLSYLFLDLYCSYENFRLNYLRNLGNKHTYLTLLLTLFVTYYYFLYWENIQRKLFHQYYIIFCCSC